MKKCDVKYALMPMEYKNYSISLESVPVLIVSKCYVLDDKDYYTNEKRLGKKVAFPYHIFWNDAEFKYNFVREEGVASIHHKNDSFYVAHDLFDTFEEASMAAGIQNRSILYQYMASVFEQGNSQECKSFHDQHTAMCKFFEKMAVHLEQLTADIKVSSGDFGKKYTKTK